MRNAAILLSVVLLCPPAWAGEAPLPPGKPAGVKPAISQTTEIYLLVAGATIATIAGIALFNMSSKTSAATSTTP